MEKNIVYELAKTLQQTEGLEKDFLEMMSSLRAAVEKNYVQKIQMAAGNQKAFAVEHPPKEVTLLRAIAPFLDEAGRSQINGITHSLLFLHTLQSVSRGVESITQDGGLLAARSADCPPDALTQQSAKMAGILLTLALADQF